MVAPACPTRRFRLWLVLGVLGAVLLAILVWFPVANLFAARAAYDKVRMGMTESEIREALGPPTSKLLADPRTETPRVVFVWQAGSRELLVRFEANVTPKSLDNIVVEKQCGDWHEGDFPPELRSNE